MKRNLVIKEISNNKIIAVIRTSTKEKAMMAVDACIRSGFKVIELTFTIPDVESIIEYAIKKYRKDNILIGTGTVLTTQQALISCNLKCDFVVAPNTNKDIAEICNENQILYIPGVMTVNEITKAIELECPIVKLFPANNYNPTFIRAIKAPLPNIKIMVTGGISEKNIKEWIEAGADACGVGGNLIEPIEKENDANKVMKIAQLYFEAIK